MIHRMKRTTRPGGPDYHVVRFDWEQSADRARPSDKTLYVVHLAESAHRNLRGTAPAKEEAE